MLQLTGVSGFDSVDAIIRIVAIAIPIAVLVTLLLVLSTKRRVKRRRSSVATLADGIEPDAPEAAPSIPPATALAIDAQPEPPVALSAEAPIDHMQARLKHSITIEPKTAQAELHLQMARLHRSQGDEGACLSALRAAAGLAAQHGPRSIHAEARLELAEVAYEAGDLTSACEHWQMARTALLDDGQKEAHARVDKRMRENGCPTDWVLTDF